MVHSSLYVLIHAATGVMLLAGGWAAAQEIKINIGLGGPPVPPVVVTTPPQLIAVPGSPVYYAPEVSANLFFYKGRYYTLVNNIWSTAQAYNGPWAVIHMGKVPQPILTVPVDYYKVPPGHLKGKGRPPWAGHGQKSKKPKD